MAPSQEIGGVGVILFFKKQDRGDRTRGVAAIAGIGVADGDRVVQGLMDQKDGFTWIPAFNDGTHGFLLPLAQPFGDA